VFRLDGYNRSHQKEREIMVKVKYEKEDLTEAAEIALGAVTSLVDVMDNMEIKTSEEVNECEWMLLDTQRAINLMLDHI